MSHRRGTGREASAPDPHVGASRPAAGCLFLSPADLFPRLSLHILALRAVSGDGRLSDKERKGRMRWCSSREDRDMASFPPHSCGHQVPPLASPGPGGRPRLHGGSSPRKLREAALVYPVTRPVGSAFRDGPFNLGSRGGGGLFLQTPVKLWGPRQTQLSRTLAGAVDSSVLPARPKWPPQLKRPTELNGSAGKTGRPTAGRGPGCLRGPRPGCSPVKCEEGVTAESRRAGAHEGPCPMQVQTAWSEERSGEAWPSVGTDSWVLVASGPLL